VSARVCGALDARAVAPLPTGSVPRSTHTRAQVHNLTVRAKGKLLLENTSLTITAGAYRFGALKKRRPGVALLGKEGARAPLPRGARTPWPCTVIDTERRRSAPRPARGPRTLPP
jgi:hypothetical protein